MNAVPKFTESQVIRRAEELFRQASWSQMTDWYESASHTKTDACETALRKTIDDINACRSFGEMFSDLCWEGAVESAKSELFAEARDKGL